MKCNVPVFERSVFSGYKFVLSISRPISHLRGRSKKKSSLTISQNSSQLLYPIEIKFRICSECDIRFFNRCVNIDMRKLASRTKFLFLCDFVRLLQKRRWSIFSDPLIEIEDLVEIGLKRVLLVADQGLWKFHLTSLQCFWARYCISCNLAHPLSLFYPSFSLSPIFSGSTAHGKIVGLLLIDMISICERWQDVFESVKADRLSLVLTLNFE